MKLALIQGISFFFLVVTSQAQGVVFEPDNISVAQKTTHEISFTRDGQIVYFTQTVDNSWGKSQVGFSSNFFNGKWSKPARVEFADNLYNMSVSPDGGRVLFCKDDRTWVCWKENGQWSSPKDLSSGSDFSFLGGYYHILDDQSFYYSGVQENNSHPYDDIYYVGFQSGNYQKPKRLNANINTAATEFSPWVSSRKDVMIFSRYDASSEANSGIFLSRFEAGEWQLAQKVEALQYGWGVFVREDTGTLYYTKSGLVHAYQLDSLGINLQ